MKNIETRIEQLENLPGGDMRTLIIDKAKNLTPEQRAERFKILKKKLFQPIEKKSTPEYRRKIEALRVEVIQGDSTKTSLNTHLTEQK